jgi:mannose-1-phosphate guanylyltransferase
MAHISTDEVIQWMEANDRDSYDLLIKESMTASLKEYEPGSSTAAHDRIHEEDEFYYIISGSGRVQIEDDVYSVTNGDCIFAEAGDWHTFFDVDEKIVVLKIFPTKVPSGEIHREGSPVD